MPAGESPLLLPANEHKQLVVIDFEYANANLPGLEFANHFVSIPLKTFHPSYQTAKTDHLEKDGMVLQLPLRKPTPTRLFHQILPNSRGAIPLHPRIPYP